MDNFDEIFFNEDLQEEDLDDDCEPNKTILVFLSTVLIMALFGISCFEVNKFVTDKKNANIQKLIKMEKIK